jgi:hypothetical protein
MHLRIAALPLAVAAAALIGLAGSPASATHTPSHQEDGAAAQAQELQQQQLLLQRRHVVAALRSPYSCRASPSSFAGRSRHAGPR